MSHHSAHNLAEAKMLGKENLIVYSCQNVPRSSQRILEELTTGEIKQVSDFWVQEDSAEFPLVSLGV